MPGSKKAVRLRDVRVGLFVLGAIGVLIFLILNASGDISPFSKKLKVRAQFANGDGLRAGSEVRLAGVRIGKVDRVELLAPQADREAKVEVTMSIDSEIDGKSATDLIRTDSRAILGSANLLGSDKLINITPGSAVGNPVPENFLIPPGKESGSVEALTTSGTELMEQLNKLSVEFTDIATKVNEGEGTLGRFVNDEAFYNNLNGTIRETQTLIRQIQSGEGTAAKLVNDPALYNNLNQISLQLNAIATDLRAGRGTAGRLLTDDALYNDMRGTISRFNRSVDEINVLVTDLRSGRGTMGKLLTDEALYNDARASIARLNTTTERLDSLMTSVQRGEGTVGKLFTDDQLYSNFNQLSSESVKLMYDFRQNPRKYLTIKFELF